MAHQAHPAGRMRGCGVIACVVAAYFLITNWWWLLVIPAVVVILNIVGGRGIRTPPRLPTWRVPSPQAARATQASGRPRNQEVEIDDRVSYCFLENPDEMKHVMIVDGP